MGRKRDAHGDARGSGTLRDGVSGEMPSQCSVVRPPDELKQPGAASPNTPSPRGRGGGTANWGLGFLRVQAENKRFRVEGVHLGTDANAHLPSENAVF